MLFQSLYTWRIPSGFLCIQPFTQPLYSQNITYLFTGNYLDTPSGHPLATLVLTQSVAGIENHRKGERHEMKDKFLKFSAKIQTVFMSEEGQDLIEYALVVALIAFAATVGMNSVAGGINKAFQNIGTKLSSYTS
jgi:pilus assembly protein Flp/PilA